MHTGVGIRHSGERRNPAPDSIPASLPRTRSGAGVTFSNEVRKSVFLVPGILLVTTFLSACGSPRPILYPNAHLKAVGPEVAEYDVDLCRRLAEEGMATGSGPATGATAGPLIGGDPGRALVAGSAAQANVGLLSSLFGSDNAELARRPMVERCLRERGYVPVGWK